MHHNLWKDRQFWGMISKVLMKTGETVRAHGILYKLVAHRVLIYGSNSFVVIGEMIKALEGFHQQEAWWVVGMIDRCTEDKEWE